MTKTTTKSKPANKQSSGKRGGKTRTSWPPGQSGNPAGRPRDGESWAAVIKEVSNMTTEEILQFVGANNDLGRALAKMPKKVQMKYLVTARVFAALMFEPTSALWKELMERAEGKVVTPVDLDPDGKGMKVIIEYADTDQAAETPSGATADQA